MAIYNTTSNKTQSAKNKIVADLNNRYSDLDLRMTLHPQKKDVVPIKGELAVKNAVRNLLLTNFYDRPFQSSLGSNLRGLLFEPPDAITELALKSGIQKVLELYEPRIENINIIINYLENSDEYNIGVVFSIKANDLIEDIEINLRRLR